MIYCSEQIDTSGYPEKVQVLLKEYGEVNVNDFDNWDYMTDNLLKKLYEIDESEDYENNWVAKIERLLGF